MRRRVDNLKLQCKELAEHRRIYHVRGLPPSDLLWRLTCVPLRAPGDPLGERVGPAAGGRGLPDVAPADPPAVQEGGQEGRRLALAPRGRGRRGRPAVIGPARRPALRPRSIQALQAQAAGGDG